MYNLFYTDLNKSYSYDDLINRLNQTDEVVTNLHNFEVLDFFINLICGIISDTDMLLLDNDFTISEVEHLIESPYRPNRVSIPQLELSSVNDLIQRVQMSKSKLKFFTSGTTGVPKVVEHDIINLTRNIKTDDRFSGNIWGFAYNPTHMAGLQVFLQALLNANNLINIFRLNKEEVYQSIDKYKITHISATPTFYRLLYPSTLKYNSVLQITFGGEKSDAQLHDRMKGIFPCAKIKNVYASTEAGTLLATENEGFSIPQKLKSQIRIHDGELFIHRALLGNAQLVGGDEWYASGDMIEFLDEGKDVFKILARRSEMINVGGYKVNPGEVEAALRSMKEIQECRVYGVPNSILGNILCADICLAQGNISESEIKRYLTNSLQNFKVPRKIYFKDNITLNRSGKIDRKNVE